NYQSIQEKSFVKKVKFVLFFEGSVRGLNIGAPVEFKGIQVGSVVDVRLEFIQDDSSFRIPVLIEIEPERVISRGGETVSPYQFLQSMVGRGLRARLQTGSLLTGQLFVELDMHPETPIRMVSAGEGLPELPTIPTPLDEMATSVKAVLKKLEGIDIKTINAQLVAILSGASTLVNAPELQQSVKDAGLAISTMQGILSKLDKRIEPMALNLELAIGSGKDALGKIDRTLLLMNDVLAPQSPLQHGVIEMTMELAETARSIRALVDLLERNPESMIFGKGPRGE
ncbi:MAG: MCE family protein, partial [Magnetococcales bacterium]|nr:MCE family protein [Magnetococcales bacterium]